VSGGHCPKCWSGEPTVPGHLCRRCYAWYQDWLYRRLPQQKASLEAWAAERERWPRWCRHVTDGVSVTPWRQSDPDPPAWWLEEVRALTLAERDAGPPEWVPRPTWGVPDPAWRHNGDPAWENVVRVYEEVTGEDVT
jgi:hypothetical protein